MQMRSSGSVKVLYLDRQKVLAQVRQAVARLTRQHPEVEKVILFGSMAKGTAVPGSDVDLLVVLSRSGRPFLERIPQYTPEDVGTGVDAFPYTEAELQRMLEDGNPLVRQALKEGVCLFERDASKQASPP